NPLPKIQVTQLLKEVFATSVASSPKHDPLRYQLDRFDGVFYSVSPKGQIEAFDGKKKLWEQRPSKDITAGITVDQGVAVVGSRQGKLFALDAKTGQSLWQQQLSGSVLTPSLIHQNRVISISNDGTVYANDIATGQLIWTFDVPNPALSVRGYAAPVLLDDRTVAIATANAYVYAVDVITGIPSWQRRVAVSEGRGDIQRLIDVDGAPVVMDHYMVTVSYQGQVTVVDLNSQQVVWSEKASSLNSPAVDTANVYVANSDGRLVAYDLQNGQKLWENDQLLHRGLSNPVIINNLLVVGDYDGVLHLINPSNGEITGRAKTRGDVRTLRVEDNLLYVSTTKVMKPVIALIGRPNVGKSTLFNQITKSRDALVADFAGLTRDRKYGDATFQNKSFIVVDTGGIGESEQGIDSYMAEQSKTAIHEADIILFVVDARAGLLASDEQIARELRTLGKKVFLVANKVDGTHAEAAVTEFFKLGFGEPIHV
ncbi:hypothetical protein GWI33_010052, partial [Rhynchophorus ferrugineus]